MSEMMSETMSNKVTNPCWDIFSPDMVDLSTVEYNMVEYRELNVTNSSGLPSLEIETRDRDAFILPNEGALELRIRLATDDNGTALPATDKVALQNCAMSVFSDARLFIEDQEIEKISNPGLAHHIVNVSNFSKQFGDTIASNEHYYLDTMDKAILPNCKLRFFNNTAPRVGVELYFAANATPNIAVIGATSATLWVNGDDVLLKVEDANGELKTVTCVSAATYATANLGDGLTRTLTLTATGQLGMDNAGGDNNFIRAFIPDGSEVMFYSNDVLITPLQHGAAAVGVPIDYAGIAVGDLITGTVHNVTSAPFNQGFFKRWLQAKKSVGNVNDLISLWIPLRHIFKFYQAFDKVSRGFRHKVVFNKETTLSNALLKFGNHADRFFRIEYVSMWVPRLKPDLQTLKDIESKLVSGITSNINFTDLTYFKSSKQLQGTGNQALSLASTERKIIRCWVAFQKATRADGDQSTNKRVFDTMLTSNMQVRLNGTFFPNTPYRFDVSSVGGTPTFRYYNRAYNAMMSSGYKLRDDLDGSMITQEQFKDLYPIFYFDMTNQNEDLFKNTKYSELEVAWTNNGTQGDYYVYIVYESERQIKIKGVNGSLQIAL